MADFTVRVRGLRETQRALKQLDGSVRKDFRNELKKAAEPVVPAVRSRLARFRGVSMNVSPRVLGAKVVVRQNAKKVTGLRGDFGAVQMRAAFIPAVEEKAGRVAHEVDNAIGRFIDKAGL